ncbi:MFS transporter [Streptomyces sp. NPDC094038]|uniref:MFS transporter n=1 Tax=Streptomyces sp. NPDC094038 TaxID=3366055 RepID=UPI0038308D81
MTTTSHKPAQGPAVLRPRRLGMLLVLFVALTLAAALSEGVYDIAFANLALDLSGLVSTIGLVYCAGYGVEVVASLAIGPLLDRRDPTQVLIASYLLKIAVFVLIALGSSFLSSQLWTIVVAAASVDFVHQVGQMALFVLLPRLVDADTLVKVQGIGASARAASQILSPLVAGLVISLLPGARGLIAAAGFQILALLLFAGLVAAVRHGAGTPPPAPLPRTTAQPAESGPAPEALPSRRTVAGTILSSRAWSRYLVFHALTVLALSTAILSLIPLMRETLDMSAARSGTFLSASTAGALLGGLAVTRSGADRIYASMRWAPALAGTGTLIAALLGRTPWLLALGLVVFGFGFTVYLRSSGLVVQLRAPADLLGTWNGLLDAVIRVVSAAGILAAGFLFDLAGGRAVYVTLGIVLLMTALLWTSFSTSDQNDLRSTPLHRN